MAKWPFSSRHSACEFSNRLKFCGSIDWHNIDLHTKFQQKILIFKALAGCHISKIEKIISGPFLKISQNPSVGTLAWLRTERLQKERFLSHSYHAHGPKTCFWPKTSAAIFEFLVVLNIFHNYVDFRHFISISMP